MQTHPVQTEAVSDREVDRSSRHLERSPAATAGFTIVVTPLSSLITSTHTNTEVMCMAGILTVGTIFLCVLGSGSR